MGSVVGLLYPIEPSVNILVADGAEAQEAQPLAGGAGEANEQGPLQVLGDGGRLHDPGTIGERADQVDAAGGVNGNSAVAVALGIGCIARVARAWEEDGVLAGKRRFVPGGEDGPITLQVRRPILPVADGAGDRIGTQLELHG